MPWAPTTEQILNLDGVRRRADSWRFELTDPQGEALGELSPDRDRPPVISYDTGRAGGRTLTGFHLPASEQTAINVVTDRVRPYMVLQDGTEWPLGVFLWGDDSRPERGWGQERFSSLVDRTIALNQDTIGSVGWSPGGHAGLILIFLMLDAGLSVDDLGSTEGTDTQLTEPIAYPPGSNRLRIMTDVCEQVGVTPPWFDRHGQVNFVIPPDPESTEPQIPAYELGGRVIADSVVRSDDLLRAPNTWHVYDTGAKANFRGTYQLPSVAPHSIANRGFRVADVQSMQGLTSNTAARRAARSLATTRGLAFDWVAWSSTADPRHDGWDVVQVLGERYVETAWSMTCRSGAPMTHVARKVYADDG